MLRQNTRGELIGAHFEAEKSDRRAVIKLAAVALPFEMFLGAVEGDVGGKRGFAHAGAACQNDKIGRVKARGFLVNRGKAGGFARQPAPRIHRGLSHPDCGECSFAESGCL